MTNVPDCNTSSDLLRFTYYFDRLLPQNYVFYVL